MLIDKNPPAPSMARSLPRRTRRRRPGLERLEGRTLLTLNFTAGFALQGDGVSISQVADDAQGDAYVAGSYSGTAIFGTDSGGNTIQKTSTGAFNEAFVVKYSSGGTLDWFTQFQPQDGGSSDNAFSLALAGQTVYVVGDFTGTVDFDPFGVGDVQTSSNGGSASDAYIVALSASTGHVADSLFDDYAETFSNLASVTPSAVTIDPTNGAIDVGGSYAGTQLTISSASGTQFINLASPPSVGSEGFIASFNPNFSLNWAVNTTDGSGNTFDNGVVNGCNRAGARDFSPFPLGSALDPA
jgi:hypothetical protein